MIVELIFAFACLAAPLSYLGWKDYLVSQKEIEKIKQEKEETQMCRSERQFHNL